jgi:hypothetical protein
MHQHRPRAAHGTRRNSTYSFDLDVASSADEAVQAWQMAENAFAAVALRPTGRHGLRAAVRTRALGDLVIADWSTPDFEGVRTREMADAEADSIFLITVSEGRQIIETSHDALVLRPGSLALITTWRPGRVVVPGRLVKRATVVKLRPMRATPTSSPKLPANAATSRPSRCLPSWPTWRCSPHTGRTWLPTVSV